jgi:hypothetical protein
LVYVIYFGGFGWLLLFLSECPFAQKRDAQKTMLEKRQQVAQWGCRATAPARKLTRELTF